MKYSLQDNLLTLTLPNRLSHNVFYKFNLHNVKPSFLLIDFAYVTDVTLSGALYLVCLGGFLSKHSSYQGCKLVNISAPITYSLIRFGFFNLMSLQGKMIPDQDIQRQEERLVQKNNIKKHLVTENEIVLPAQMIQIGNQNHYETYINNFFNHFYDFYTALAENSEFNFSLNKSSNSQKEFSEISNAIFELIKNIYDHSYSWGLGAIHASLQTGTQITFYDIGVGIYNSVKKESGANDEKSALLWAFRDGNTSKPSINQGHGFTVMQRFVKEKNGILSIKSGNQHIYSNQGILEFKQTSWFPGTQIVIFIPTKPFDGNSKQKSR